MRQSEILSENSYEFSDYFKMRSSTEEIVNYFGYSRKTEELDLPKFVGELPFIEKLSEKVEEALVNINLESEITRREFLIAPIVFEVRHFTQSKLCSEYWIENNHQLKGSCDYFLRGHQNLLLVAPKNEDLYRGFKQLAVQLIALKEWINDDELNFIYGAVSTGNAWQFGRLDIQNKHIVKDLNIYTVPRKLEELMKILTGILERKH